MWLQSQLTGSAAFHGKLEHRTALHGTSEGDYVIPHRQHTLHLLSKLRFIKPLG